MQVTTTEWAKHLNITGTSTDPIIIFTTESENVTKEQQAFVAENKEVNYPFKFDFVTNTEDVTPNTGFVKAARKFKTESQKYFYLSFLYLCNINDAYLLCALLLQ